MLIGPIYSNVDTKRLYYFRDIRPQYLAAMAICPVQFRLYQPGHLVAIAMVLA